MRKNHTVGRGSCLGSVRGGGVYSIGEQALLRKLVEEVLSFQILVLGGGGPCVSGLKVDQDDVALLDPGRLCEASLCGRMLHARYGFLLETPRRTTGAFLFSSNLQVF